MGKHNAYLILFYFVENKTLAEKRFKKTLAK